MVIGFPEYWFMNTINVKERCVAVRLFYIRAAKQPIPTTFHSVPVKNGTPKIILKTEGVASGQS